ncbi:MAG: VCBS repeat-containing protein [Bacteroidia bacterium]|nr:VCBS repeat-containing protein [Bacteroidia bacterium]
MGYCLLAVGAWGQGRWQTAPPVVVGTDTLQSPWTGGFSTPQVGSLHLNGDTLADLVVYEPASTLAFTFLATGTPGQYRWAPAYAQYLPATPTSSWLLAYDYDADGRTDLWADTLSGIRVLRNTGPPLGPPTFEVRYPRLRSEFLSGSDTLSVTLFNLSSDLPGVADVDHDGDTDILAWDVFGDRVRLYRNRAHEDYGRTDTLVYRQASNCWGHFLETYDPATNQYAAELGQLGCDILAAEQLAKAVQHTGGALLPIELTGDTLMDLLVSDSGVESALGLYNGGTQRFAEMVLAEPQYPTAAPIRLPAYPSFYHVEVTGDGLRDLVVGSQGTSGLGPNAASVWLYENRGADDAPLWHLRQRNFLQDQTLDLGQNAQAACADLTGDGLTDLLIASGGLRDSTEALRVLLQRYANVGTAAAPVYRLLDSNYLGLSVDPRYAGVTDLAPALGDADGDGDADLVLGYQRAGNPTGLTYYRNTAGPGAPAVFEWVSDDLGGLRAQNLNALAPAFGDVDRDGDLDLVVGEQLGRLVLLENVGTTTAPSYQPRGVGWGGVQTGTPGLPSYPRPWVVDLDRDGTPDLLLGSQSGALVPYTGLSTAPGAVFTALPPLPNLPAGARTAPSGYASGPDSLALVVGTERGGLMYTHIAGQPAPVAEPTTGADCLRLLPNPATGSVQVVAPAGTPLHLIAPDGKRVAAATVPESGGPLVLPLAGLVAGVYVVEYTCAGQPSATRLVVY